MNANAIVKRWKLTALGCALLGLLSACVATEGDYAVGVYGPSVYEYGGWRGGYHVAPPRGGERRPERREPRTYRPAERSRPAPSIPTGHHGRG